MSKGNILLKVKVFVSYEKAYNRSENHLGDDKHNVIKILRFYLIALSNPYRCCDDISKLTAQVPKATYSSGSRSDPTKEPQSVEKLFPHFHRHLLLTPSSLNGKLSKNVHFDLVTMISEIGSVTFQLMSFSTCVGFINMFVHSQIAFRF